MGQNEKIKPIEMEKAILGEILYSDPQTQLDIFSNLGTKYFIDQRNKKIFEAFGHTLLKNKEISPVLVVEYCQDHYPDISVQEISSFNYFTTGGLSAEGCILYLKERYYKREVKEKINNTLSEIQKEKLYEDIQRLKNELIANLSSLEIDTASDFIDHNSNLEKIKENISKKLKFFLVLVLNYLDYVLFSVGNQLL